MHSNPYYLKVGFRASSVRRKTTFVNEKRVYKAPYSVRVVHCTKAQKILQVTDSAPYRVSPNLTVQHKWSPMKSINKFNLSAKTEIGHLYSYFQNLSHSADFVIQVERERNLLNSKLTEFENLLRNPYYLSSPGSPATTTPFHATNSNATSMGVQNNVPIPVSSFSQLGSSINSGYNTRQDSFQSSF